MQKKVGKHWLRELRV